MKVEPRLTPEDSRAALSLPVPRHETWKIENVRHNDEVLMRHVGMPTKMDLFQSFDVL